MNSLEEEETKVLLETCEFHGVEKLSYSIYHEGSKNIVVVRDDRLCGGTKSRILSSYLEEDVGLHYSEYVYAGNAWGGAQVALAEAIFRLNEKSKKARYKAVIFIQKPPIPSAQMKAAQKMGARYVYVSSHQDARENATHYVESQRGRAILLPNGFRTDKNIARLAEIMSPIRRKFGRFDEAWVTVATGALLKAMQKADLAKRYVGVCVFGHCPSDTENAKQVFPSMPFEELPDPRDLPPFPSALRYDAKMWKEVMKRARGNTILMWNVLA